MATKTSAPSQPKGVQNNSISYSPKNRGDCETSNTKAKGQISGGGLNGIEGKNPEVGTTDAQTK
jgi:hypothetical protein